MRRLLSAARLHERFAEGRTYFEAPVLANCSDDRLRERHAITDVQAQAWRLNDAGQHEAAAKLYEDAAGRWEALGGYDDSARDARHMARRCRRGERLGL